jgi:hypothetical protein
MGRAGMKRRWADTLGWPLATLLILFFALVLFISQDLWLPTPFPHY